MKLLKGEFFNFGSYEHIEFDFLDLGLVLIKGATGSGKSTLCDMPFWTLFGKTSKNGTVDEVRSWKTPSLLTKGILKIEINGEELEITRIRGISNVNDLYWTEGKKEEKNRGKDISETQSFLQKKLGFSENTYAAAAYCHEFSSANFFFVANSKDRRKLLEEIADLSKVINLKTKFNEKRKELKKVLIEQEKAKDRVKAQVEELEVTINATSLEAVQFEETRVDFLQKLKAQDENFTKEQANKISILKTKKDLFENKRINKINELKNKIDDLVNKHNNTASDNLSLLEKRLNSLDDPRCLTCGALTNHKQRENIIYDINKLKEKISTNLLINQKIENNKQLLSYEELTENPYSLDIEKTLFASNTYKEEFIKEKNRSNPFISHLTKSKERLNKLKTLLNESLQQVTVLNNKVTGLLVLEELTLVLKANIIAEAVNQLQTNTNSFLQNHFDSEISVLFYPKEDDSIEVVVNKGGYECSYTQLSKGQRGLLKLCFSAAVMEAASNQSGIKFDNLFYDEALDGLDSILQVKAFNLFQQLSKSHSTIVVVSHSIELQQMFDNQIQVSIIEDESTIDG